MRKNVRALVSNDPVSKVWREKQARRRWNQYQRQIKRSEKFESYRDKHPEQWKIYTLKEFNEANA